MEDGGVGVTAGFGSVSASDAPAPADVEAVSLTECPPSLLEESFEVPESAIV